MKKQLLAVLLLLACLPSFSSTAYQYDKNFFSDDFAKLDSVESKYFTEKEAGQLESFKEKFAEQSPIVSASRFSSASTEEFYFDFEGFAWGFCCCPIGFFVIAINDNKDQDQKVSYWIGVISNTVLSALFQIAILVAS